MAANKVWALTLLSAQLRSELVYVVSFPCLSVHPLLLHLSQVSSLPMLHQLVNTALSQKSLAATDVLFDMGTHCAHMHIIVGGCIAYTSTSDARADDPEIRLKFHDWLCEPAMWTHWLHRGIATSRGESELVSIDALAFIKALKGYAVHGEVRYYAENFIEKLSLLARKLLTDVNTLPVEELTELVQRIVDRSGSGRNSPRVSRMMKASRKSAKLTA